jgi:pilus assembly protein Flp/PilA
MSIRGELHTGLNGSEETGQGLAEYALILALIAIIAVVAVAFLGGSIQGALSMIGDTVHGVL